MLKYNCFLVIRSDNNKYEFVIDHYSESKDLYYYPIMCSL